MDKVDYFRTDVNLFLRRYILKVGSELDYDDHDKNVDELSEYLMKFLKRKYKIDIKTLK